MIHNVIINIKHLSECLAGRLVDNFDVSKDTFYLADADLLVEEKIAEYIENYLTGYFDIGD